MKSRLTGFALAAGARARAAMRAVAKASARRTGTTSFLPELDRNGVPTGIGILSELLSAATSRERMSDAPLQDHASLQRYPRSQPALRTATER